jgi:hypothetical protein
VLTVLLMEVVDGLNDVLEAAGLSRQVVSIDHMVHFLPTLIVMLYDSFFDAKLEGILVTNPTSTSEELQNIETILSALQNYNKNGISARSLISGDLEQLRGFVELFSLISKSVQKPKSRTPIFSSRDDLTELKLIVAKVNHLDERLTHEMARAEGYFQLRSEALKLKVNGIERIPEISQQADEAIVDKEPVSSSSPYKAMPHLHPPEKRKKKGKKKSKEPDPKISPEGLDLESNPKQSPHDQAIVPSRPSSSAPSKRKPVTRRLLAATQTQPLGEGSVLIQRPVSAPNQRASPRSKEDQHKQSLNQDSSQQGSLEKGRGLHKPPAKVEEVTILPSFVEQDL